MESADIVIAGGGIGGLTLALELDRVGIACRVYEAVPAPAPIGVGITILPHAARVLFELGLGEELRARGVLARESVFYNRFGQFIYREEVGEHAGLPWPQLFLHRGDLYEVLLDAVRRRLGEDAVVFDARLLRASQDERRATAVFATGGASGREETAVESADAVVGCDGIHSTLRRQLYPDEVEPRYQGYNMWRGVTTWSPFLSRASMLRIGWYTSGKFTVYPCRDDVDGNGSQLLNWIAGIETPRHLDRDWGRIGRLEDFVDTFAEWHFEFLDVPAVIEAADAILEYPMVDQDPLPRWSFGRLTLLGDAAHPMVPRGSNGAGQAIVDCRSLATSLAVATDVEGALRRYEAERLPVTAGVVHRNRVDPPDAILREVCLRTGDRPFARLEDVISNEELDALSESYRDTTGYSRRAFAALD